MALKLNLSQSSLGCSFPEAYARVAEVFAFKERSVIRVAVHASEDARQANAQIVELRQHEIDTAALAGPIWPAAYTALKALPEYAGAEDC